MMVAIRLSGAWKCVLALSLAAMGCEFPGKPVAADRYIPPREERSFDVLFQKNCAACHGANGTLGPAPPLNDPLLLAIIPNAELRRVISQGRSGTLMPAFEVAYGGHLTAEQIEILADGIKTLWGSADVRADHAPPYLLAPGGDPAAGAKVFARVCATCHGDNGMGGDKAGAINDRDFLTLLSDQVLRRLVITGRPDLGMPDYTGPKGESNKSKPLTAQEVTDIVALLSQWRKHGLAAGMEN